MICRESDNVCVECIKDCDFCKNSEKCITCTDPFQNFDGECGMDCKPGYGLQSNGSCGEICGDGVKRASLPYCDDGNTMSGDGCSANCTIEDGWFCDLGDRYTVDRCREIPVFTLTQENTDTRNTFIMTFNVKMAITADELKAALSLQFAGYDKILYPFDVEKISATEFKLIINNVDLLREPEMTLKIKNDLLAENGLYFES